LLALRFAAHFRSAPTAISAGLLASRRRGRTTPKLGQRDRLYRQPCLRQPSLHLNREYEPLTLIVLFPSIPKVHDLSPKVVVGMGIPWHE
jgi:hypothetical protein